MIFCGASSGEGERNYEKEQEKRDRLQKCSWMEKGYQKKHETVTNSASMLDFYLQLKWLFKWLKIINTMSLYKDDKIIKWSNWYCRRPYKKVLPLL